MATIWDRVLDGNVADARVLLENGVGVDTRNSLGETPLHLAARHGLEEMARALIDAGASVHVKDWESGWTPLHRSLYFGHVRLSLLLLQAGALLDGGRDQPDNERRQKHRSRSRSESLSLPGKSRGSASSRRRIKDGLGDHEGKSPLDVLSLELRSHLESARESGVGGDVFSFGKADFTLGYDSFGRADVLPPRRVEALANLHVTRVAASKHHSAAVTLCGKLFTWGHGKSGRLGHGSEEVCMLPTLVEALANQKVVDVAAAETHTAAVTSEGELYTWGRDRFGQLGHGSAGSSGKLAPKRVEGLRKATVTGVAAGSEHTAVVTRSGNCYTFGRNNHGQLGLAGVKETSSPRVVSYLSSGASRGAGGVGRHVIKVSASARSTVVITRGVDRGSGLQSVNEVHQWGHGSHVPSRVNFNSNKDATPTARWQTHDARVDIVDIAAARCHNIALDRAGMVFTWGFGADNLGLDPREARTARGPKLVAAMLPENCGGNPVSVSASDQHSCVVTDAGDLFTWGTSGEEGGALGHGPNRWQPLAKRVPSLKKVVSVAAAPDHTVVLLQASCPSLPHDASFVDVAASNGAHEDGNRSLADEEEGDADSDIDDANDEGDHFAGDDGLSCVVASAAASGCEPLTLKQCCEVKLAKEVDLHNAGAMLAYADALDAPELLLYCAEYIVRNLDAVLVLGCESTNCCLLEASGELASSLLCGARARVATKRVPAAEPVTEDGAGFSVYEEEGVDPEMEATALARADMRAKTPSAKVAARAVRSLKKKIARVREWEAMRARGKDLSAEQVSKVNQRARMEAELTSLDSQLERAKLAQAARSSRLEADDSLKGVPLGKSCPPEVKRNLFQDEKRNPNLDPDLRAPSTVTGKGEEWTPQLDLSHDEAKANEKRVIVCEACAIKCANAAMYADHLRGQRHRATTLRLEQQLQRATKASQPEPQLPRTWATVSVAQDRPVSTAAIPSASAAEAAAVLKDANLGESGKGRRASFPAANPSHSYQSSRDFNQLPRGGEVVTMRQTLEDQQRAATMMIGCTRKVIQEEAASAGQGVTFKLTPAKSRAGGASQRLPAPQDATPPAVYSLVDFIAAPGSKKSSRRGEGPDREEQAAGKTGQAWAKEAEQAESNTSDPGESRVEGVAKAEKKPLPTRKSFHEILQEEEREKKERDEYGESVWFVSRKPRSTSFETIVQQQRREERAAEEEKLEAMEEEMLGLALEMSKQEAERAAPQSHGRGSRKGRGGKQRKEVDRPNGQKQESKAPRTQPNGRAKGSSRPRSGGNAEREAAAQPRARGTGSSQPRGGNKEREQAAQPKARAKGSSQPRSGNKEREAAPAQGRHGRRGHAKGATAGGDQRAELKAEVLTPL